MNRNRKVLLHAQDGYLAIEACVIVPLFIFFVITCYGMISIFMAQNTISHALLQSAQSMALEAYSNEKISSADSVSSWISKLYQDSKRGQEGFHSDKNWSTGDQVQLATVAKERTIAYLAGNEANAQQMLNNLRVVNGVDGLSFSQSRIEGDDLYLVVEYQVNFFFNPFGIGPFSGRQEVCTHLWRA